MTARITEQLVALATDKTANDEVQRTLLTSLMARIETIQGNTNRWRQYVNSEIDALIYSARDQAHKVIDQQFDAVQKTVMLKLEEAEHAQQQELTEAIRAIQMIERQYGA